MVGARVWYERVHLQGLASKRRGGQTNVDTENAALHLVTDNNRQVKG